MCDCDCVPDVLCQGMIKATCLALHHHICEGCLMAWPIDSRFDIFNDPPGMEARGKNPANFGGASSGGGMQDLERAHMLPSGWEGRGQKELPPPSYEKVLLL